MPRKPSVNYWPSRGGYGCWHQGQQHILATGPNDAPTGPTYLAALEQFRDLLALRNADTARDRNTVRTVCELYLQDYETGHAASSLRIRRLRLGYFIDAGYGDMEVGKLLPWHVKTFIAERRKPHYDKHRKRTVRWGDGNVRLFLDSLNAAFNWAVKNQLLTANPVRDVERPAARSRGRDCIVSREDHPRILAAATPAFRPFIEVLENTGARPSEISRATAVAFDPKMGALVYYPEHTRQDGEHRHKTAGKRRKVRVVFLTGRGLEIVRDLVAKHPQGPLFRPSRGALGWSEREISRRFRDLRQKAGLPRVTAYSYRHTFATRWVESGRSIELLAEVLGTSVQMIHNHYDHALPGRDTLRQHVESFTAGSAGNRQAEAGDGASGEE